MPWRTTAMIVSPINSAAKASGGWGEVVFSSKTSTVAMVLPGTRSASCERIVSTSGNSGIGWVLQGVSVDRDRAGDHDRGGVGQPLVAAMHPSNHLIDGDSIAHADGQLDPDGEVNRLVGVKPPGTNPACGRSNGTGVDVANLTGPFAQNLDHHRRGWHLGLSAPERWVAVARLDPPLGLFTGALIVERCARHLLGLISSSHTGEPDHRRSELQHPGAQRSLILPAQHRRHGRHLATMTNLTDQKLIAINLDHLSTALPALAHTAHRRGQIGNLAVPGGGTAPGGQHDHDSTRAGRHSGRQCSRQTQSGVAPEADAFLETGQAVTAGGKVRDGAGNSEAFATQIGDEISQAPLSGQPGDRTQPVGVAAVVTDAAPTEVWHDRSAGRSDGDRTEGSGVSHRRQRADRGARANAVGFDALAAGDQTLNNSRNRIGSVARRIAGHAPGRHLSIIGRAGVPPREKARGVRLIWTLGAGKAGKKFIRSIHTGQPSDAIDRANHRNAIGRRSWRC